jgi:hypothetical protein
MTGSPIKDNSFLKQRGSAIRLTLDVSVASDLKQLKVSLKNLAERLGHSACATGCNSLYLNLQRDFLVRSDRGVVSFNPQPDPPGLSIGLPQDPIPLKSINVSVPGSVFDNIEVLGSTIEKVLGRLGCPACCSGFDLFFQREIDGFVVNAKQEITGTGQFAR